MPATPADAAAASTGPATAAFEVADVHASAFDRNRFVYPIETGNLDGDRYIWREATMTQLVAVAYSQAPPNVQGGPSWLDWDHFDIDAKTSPTASKADIQLMLQSLLKQRFNLVVHTGSAPMPVYVLTAQPRQEQAERIRMVHRRFRLQAAAAFGPADPGSFIPQLVLGGAGNETAGGSLLASLRGEGQRPYISRSGPARSTSSR